MWNMRLSGNVREVVARINEYYTYYPIDIPTWLNILDYIYNKAKNDIFNQDITRLYLLHIYLIDGIINRWCCDKIGTKQ